MFKESRMVSGVPYCLSQTIKGKSFPQCQDYITAVTNFRTGDGLVKKSVKEMIEDLINKNKIEEHEIITEIERQLNNKTNEFLLDLTQKYLYVAKKPKASMK
jgi:hypothetical protein